MKQTAKKDRLWLWIVPGALMLFSFAAFNIYATWQRFRPPVRITKQQLVTNIRRDLPLGSSFDDTLSWCHAQGFREAAIYLSGSDEKPTTKGVSAEYEKDFIAFIIPEVNTTGKMLSVDFDFKGGKLSSFSVEEETPQKESG